MPGLTGYAARQSEAAGAPVDDAERLTRSGPANVGAEQKTPSGLRRVMCVEDDPDIRMILEFGLAVVGGYEVCMCPDGPSALAQAPSFRPDLVLLDVMMPGLTGPETLAALRSQPGAKNVPAVFMTAKVMPDEIGQLLKHGALGVIVKPFDLSALPTDIRVYWERAHGVLSA